MDTTQSLEIKQRWRVFEDRRAAELPAEPGVSAQFDRRVDRKRLEGSVVTNWAAK